MISASFTIKHQHLWFLPENIEDLYNLYLKWSITDCFDFYLETSTTDGFDSCLIPTTTALMCAKKCQYYLRFLPYKVNNSFDFDLKTPMTSSIFTWKHRRRLLELSLRARPWRTWGRRRSRGGSRRSRSKTCSVWFGGRRVWNDSINIVNVRRSKTCSVWFGGRRVWNEPMLETLICLN